MEEHNGWVRYTEDPKELLTIEDYYSQYIPRMKEIKDNSFAVQSYVLY